MKNIHANPVGNINKDIYIIKNKINDKVYIGQSKDVEHRYKKHCITKPNDSLIAQAIHEYGKENFWYEVLEHNVENYNEREKYWIAHYNSTFPNGYNIQEGGDKPPVMMGDDHPSTILSDKEVALLKGDLRDSQMALSEIANKYNISKRQVLRINQGLSRAKVGEKYPIRENPNINGKLTEDQVDEIIELLRFTYRFDGDIAREYGVDVHAISRINSGATHKRDDVQYPVRKWKSCGIVQFTYEQVTEIIDELLHTKKSISAIAKEYGVRREAITQINTGTSKKYRRDYLKYPLRPY